MDDVADDQDGDRRDPRTESGRTRDEDADGDDDEEEDDDDDEDEDEEGAVAYF